MLERYTKQIIERLETTVDEQQRQKIINDVKTTAGEWKKAIERLMNEIKVFESKLIDFAQVGGYVNIPTPDGIIKFRVLWKNKANESIALISEKPLFDKEKPYMESGYTFCNELNDASKLFCQGLGEFFEGHCIKEIRSCRPDDFEVISKSYDLFNIWQDYWIASNRINWNEIGSKSSEEVLYVTSTGYVCGDRIGNHGVRPVVIAVGLKIIGKDENGAWNLDF